MLYYFDHKLLGVENGSERAHLLSSAEQHFLAANRADPWDHLTEYYLAYHYALKRNIDKATQRVRNALNLHSEHLASLHLMILLLTAKKEYKEALELTEATLDDYPDNLPLMSLKVRLEEVVHGADAAVTTAKGNK